MTRTCVLLSCVFSCQASASLLMAEGEAPPPNLVFQEDFGPDALERWSANSAKLAIVSDAESEEEPCLEIEDAGGDSQAFLRLAVEPGATYRLEIDGKRRAQNRGTWCGCAAVSVTSGRGNQGTYLARSAFIGEPDRWHRLSLQFSSAGTSVFVILTSQNADGDVVWFRRPRIFKLGSAPLRVLPAGDEPRPPTQAVALAGSPAHIGEIWGRSNAEAIRHDLEEYYLKPARSKGIALEELVRRADKFIELAEQLAPHWLPETEAVARAAGVDPQLYLAYVGTVYRGLWAGEECTSYAISPKFARDGGIFFHKTRDNQPKLQCAFLIASNVPGVNRFISVGDASVISAMMMVNEKGLAGSADVGGLKIDTPRHRGWMNTAMLRHIAERAGDCHEALAIVREFVDQGWYAGGGEVGTHWLFVDAKGRILEISNNSTRLEHAWHDDAKAYFSAPRGRAIDRLQGAAPPVDFATFHNVARDPAMCFPSSVSGMSVRIDAARPELLTQAWISMPARSLSFPLVMGGTATPLPLLTGEADAVARQNHAGAATWEPVETLAFGHLDLLADRVRRLAEAGREDEAAQAIDQWTLATTAAQLAILRPSP